MNLYWYNLRNDKSEIRRKRQFIEFTDKINERMKTRVAVIYFHAKFKFRIRRMFMY